MGNYYNIMISLCNSFYRAVYLRTQPDVVYHRMKARARQEETEVSICYLQHLHQMHEDWLFNKTAFSCPAPVNISQTITIFSWFVYDSVVPKNIPLCHCAWISEANMLNLILVVCMAGLPIPEWCNLRIVRVQILFLYLSML